MARETATSLKHFLLRNPLLRGLSLAVAVCIWSFTGTNRDLQAELTLPVELRNIPPGLMLASQPIREVRFMLTGPSILIDGARRANTTIIINLRGALPGKTVFYNMESNLKLPDNIKVTRITPASLEINLIREQKQTVEGDQSQ